MASITAEDLKANHRAIVRDLHDVELALYGVQIPMDDNDWTQAVACSLMAKARLASLIDKLLMVKREQDNG